MVKVYGPIRDQADAARAAATAANDNIITGNRAWIVPGGAGMKQPVAGEPIDVTINYSNSGHQPAN